MEEKIRKVFLEELPQGGSSGICFNQINWTKSMEYSVKFQHDNLTGIIKIIDYVKETQTLKIEYKNKEYFILTGSFQNCQLGNIIGTQTKEFKYEIGQRIIDDKRDITIIDKKKIKGKGKCYKYICNKCKYDCSEHYNHKTKTFEQEYWITEGHLLEGNNCICCSNQIVVENINSIVKTDEWMIPYFQGGYSEAKKYVAKSTLKIHPICIGCGRINNKLVSISDIYKCENSWCECSDGYSYPNKFMFELFMILGENFETEYNPEWIKPRKYDFYISSINKIVEMDGGFHTQDNNMNGVSKEESKIIDNEKDRLANQNGIEVIRINCDYRHEERFEYIKKNILESDLNGIFDLSKVDWSICNKFALSSRVKEACELWNSGIYNAVKIADIMKIAHCTSIKYLKEGSKLNMCSYTRELAIKNKPKETIFRRDIICIDNGEIYESGDYIDKNSLKIFGVKMSKSKICLVCQGKRNHTGGFHFKYTSDLTELEIQQIQENVKLNQVI